MTYQRIKTYYNGSLRAEAKVWYDNDTRRAYKFDICDRKVSDTIEPRLRVKRYPDGKVTDYRDSYGGAYCTVHSAGDMRVDEFRVIAKAHGTRYYDSVVGP